MPDVDELRKVIMKEAHFFAYSIHPGSTKMYHDLKDTYWWNGMKKDIAEFVSKCLTCQQVKLEHQRPSGLLQQLPILEWKWDMIAMDFLSGLPRTSSGYDAIEVLVGKLTRTVHFLPIKKTYSTDRLVRLYINQIVCLHGVLVSIVSNRGATFTSVFWQELHKAIGRRLDFSLLFILKLMVSLKGLFRLWRICFRCV